MPFVDDSGRSAPRAPRPRAQSTQQSAAPAVNPYDTSADPTLQRILALGQQRQADAEAEALRLREQIAIDYGDEGLARSLGLSEADIAAARGNPFSTSAKLAKGEHDRPIALNEDLNKQNLFYSGHGDLDRSNLSNALLQNRYDANSSVRGQLGQVSANELNAKRGIQGEDIAAQEDAAQRLRDRLGDLQLGGAKTGSTLKVSGVPGAIPVPTHSPVAAALKRAPALAHHPRPKLPRRARY